MRLLVATLLCAVAGCASSEGMDAPGQTIRRTFDAGSISPALSDGGARGTTSDAGQPTVCDEDRTACGVSCVDLQTDPTSCGACGVTCVIPHASAACVDGACALMACDAGRYDLDGLLDNGCEVEDRCEPGVACATRCGSEGTTTCDGPVASCAPPAEVCNSAEEDCDGLCDEDAGCRVGVFRSHGAGRGHLYTTDRGAASAAPYNIERENYFRLYSAQVPGTRPVFLCEKNGRDGHFFITSSTDCERSGAPRATLGYWAIAEQCGAVPLYRLRHPPSDNHFYTVSAAERDRAVGELGYVAEGVPGWVWP